MLKLASPRKLPGIAFEAIVPPLAESLPRMDITVFVGFASSGPLHVPVAIEDAAHFAEIFGGDLPLAWDEEKCEEVYAYLAPSVRSFFRNGGRRCWVIRVADEDTAEFNYFPIPGLLSAKFKDGNVQIKPAFARARSEGSWTDSFRVGIALSGQSVPFERGSFEGMSIRCVMSRTTRLSAGDLLSLQFDESAHILMFFVKSIEPVTEYSCSSPPGTAGMNVRIIPEKSLWLRKYNVGSPPLVPEKAYIFGHESEKLITVLPLPLDQKSGLINVYLSLELKDAPAPGSIIRIDRGTEQMWLTVREVAEHSFGSPSIDGVKLTGEAICESNPINIDGSPHVITINKMEKLTFELLVKDGDKPLARLENLGFAKSHPRFWGALPTDEALYEDHSIAMISPHKDLLLDASAPRFPLAAGDQTPDFYLPLGIGIPIEGLLNAEKQIHDSMTRNGLSVFSEGPFLDDGLKDIGIEQLITQSDFQRYQTQTEYKLKGIHAALYIEEPTIIAVPDASHRGWKPAEQKDPPKPNESPLPFRPEWWHHLDCKLTEEEMKKRPEIFRAEEPEWENFLNCDIRKVSRPRLWIKECTETNIFTLFWSPEEHARYVLQEAANPDWTDTEDIYAGTENRFIVYGKGLGVHYYRVCAEVDGIKSAWSNEVRNTSQLKRFQFDIATKDPPNTLLSVHRALLRMCAARGDLFAVLSLPEHYREEDSIRYIETLKSIPSNATGIRSASHGESPEFSYGAVYHPWLIGREEGKNIFRAIPPDGAICGIMARRALNRGAWIAPANELMTGIISLTPVIHDSRRFELQQANMNLVRQEPHGFLTLSSDTLSDDPDLRPINVRRLLILLRRLALRLGSRYVFEPNDASLRRMVRCGFEALFDDMFMRGAFAGNTPGASYQVVTDASLNTPQSIDQGRFIVDLKVAPSLPMTFLTIRL
jgi:hypothetical protein